MKLVPIRRRTLRSRAVFVRDHLSGPGEPVILTHCIDDWPARAKWSFDWFAANWGSEPGVALFEFDGSKGGTLTTLGAFIRNLDSDVASPPGIWVDCARKPVPVPPEGFRDTCWAIDWDAFRLHPELLDDIAPFPAAVPNLVPALGDKARKLLESLMRRRFHGIYISRKDTVTPFHQDHSDTSSSLAQICGEKAILMLAPSDAGLILDGVLDLCEPDVASLDDKVAVYTGTLRPGEMLFIPPRWYHHVRSLGKSITVAHTFFGEHNLGRYLESVLGNLSPGSAGGRG